MIFEPQALDGLSLLRTEPARDARGAFSRLWCAEDFAAAGRSFVPVQASLSDNPTRGVLRGMHWQAPPHGETKLLQVLRGRVFDAVVDLRRDSPTFGRHVARELAAGEGFLIAPGLAHGFLTLEPGVLLLYMMDRPHAPAASRGLRYDDPDVAIRWPHAPSIVGPRDLEWPLLRDLA